MIASSFSEIQLLLEKYEDNLPPNNSLPSPKTNSLAKCKKFKSIVNERPICSTAFWSPDGHVYWLIN